MSFKFTANTDTNDKEAIVATAITTPATTKENKVDQIHKLAKGLQNLNTIEVLSPFGDLIKVIPNVLVNNHWVFVDGQGNKLVSGSALLEKELLDTEVFISISFPVGNVGKDFLTEVAAQKLAILTEPKDDKFSASFIYNIETGTVRQEWRALEVKHFAAKVLKRLSVVHHQNHQSLRAPVAFHPRTEKCCTEGTIHVLLAEEGINTDGDNRMTRLLAQAMGISDDTPRVNLRGTTFDSQYKGDTIILTGGEPVFQSGAYDLVIYPDNDNNEVTFLQDDGEIVLGVTTPQHQYKTVWSNPQLEAAFPALFSNGTYKKQATEMMARATGRAMMGQNSFPTNGFDGDIKNANEASEYLISEVGSVFPSAWLTEYGLKQVIQRFDKSSMGESKAFRKERVVLPCARYASLSGEQLLIDKGIDVDLKENEFFFDLDGFVPAGATYRDFTVSTGGSDNDDKFATLFFTAKEDITISMRFAEDMQELTFQKGEVLALFIRFPLGGRLTNGRFGVEYWVGRPHRNQFVGRLIDNIIRRDGSLPVLGQEDFPTHILDVEEPMHTEAHGADEILTVVERAERLVDLKGTFEQYSLVMTSLMYLSRVFPVEFNEAVSGRSVDASMEFAIDTATQTFNLNHLDLVAEAANEGKEMIIEVINRIGKVDYMFALRAGLLSDKSTPENPKLDTDIVANFADWDCYMVSRNDWAEALTTTRKWINRFTDRYQETFVSDRSLTTEERAGLKKYFNARKHFDGDMPKVGNAIVQYGLTEMVPTMLSLQFLQGVNNIARILVGRALFGSSLATYAVQNIKERNAVNKMMAALHTNVYEPMLAKLNEDDAFDGAVLKVFGQAMGVDINAEIELEDILLVGDALDMYRGISAHNPALAEDVSRDEDEENFDLF